MKLADRIAIVTGAAKGMGRDICLDAGRARARTWCWPRARCAPLEALAGEIEAARPARAGRCPAT